MPGHIEYIYTLSDPRDDGIRYVGRTLDVQSRYVGHTSTKNSGNPEKDAWIRELRDMGMKPIMTVIEEYGYAIPSDASIPGPGERERFWIRHYKEKGAQLFNRPHRSANTVLPIVFAKQEQQEIAMDEEFMQRVLAKEKLMQSRQELLEQLKELGQRVTELQSRAGFTHRDVAAYDALTPISKAIVEAYHEIREMTEQATA